MRKMQKPPVKEVKTSEKEPLAEGLQTFPTDPRGRRLWSRMSDEEVVEVARKFMEEKGITGRKELEKADQGLYQVLRKRGLLDEVGFVEKYRTWTEMEDEEVIEFARIFMREREISKRYGLEKADSGLYQVLRERGLLNRVFARMEQQRDNSARDAVIDALSAFGAEN